MSNKTAATEPVRLRRRTLKDGRQSLYLDIYFTGGARRYEYLRLYLLPDGTKEAREANRRTMRLADAVRARRLLDYEAGRLGVRAGVTDADSGADFIAFFRALAEARGGAGAGNGGNWRSACAHLQRYARNRPVPFRSVTPAWCEGFRDYLLTEAVCQNRRGRAGLGDAVPLAANSRRSYFAKLRAACREAARRGMMPSDPCAGVSGIPSEETERPYLTLEEVRRLAAVPCRYASLRRAFLFSCLTGLRKSDILALRWGDVRQEGGFTRIVFRQRKTGGQEYLDITPEAVAYLGERGEPDDRPFSGFRYSSRTNAELRMWAARAGVGKEITFHSGRHTFAVLMLELGTDIYTLQKLLGHKYIATTEIYAKVLDESKREAVSRIPPIEP